MFYVSSAIMLTHSQIYYQIYFLIERAACSKKTEGICTNTGSFRKHMPSHVKFLRIEVLCCKTKKVKSKNARMKIRIDSGLQCCQMTYEFTRFSCLGMSKVDKMFSTYSFLTSYTDNFSRALNSALTIVANKLFI